MVLSARSVLQLYDAIIEGLLGELFSMRSVPRLHKRAIKRCKLARQLEAAAERCQPARRGAVGH
jgi:hypothetical protein